MATGLVPLLVASSAVHVVTYGVEAPRAHAESLNHRAMSRIEGYEARMSIDDASRENVQGDTLFLGHEAVLRIHLYGNDIDASRTSIGDKTLSQLLDDSEQGGSTWTSVELEDGFVLYEGDVALGEGAHEVTGLCKVTRISGEVQPVALDVDGCNVQSIVVDTHAPCFTVRSSAAPAFTMNASGKQTVFFKGVVDLLFDVEDASGIARAELVESSGRVRVLRSEMGRYRLCLENGTLSDDTVFVFSDRAGNRVVWSLTGASTQVTEHGEVLLPDNPITIGDTGLPLVAQGQPHKLIADSDAPLVVISGVEEGGYYRESVSLDIRVLDKNLGYVAMGAPDRVVGYVMRDDERIDSVSVSWLGANEQAEEHTYRVDVPVETTHEQDGTYRVVAGLSDLSGNESPLCERIFTVDTTPPVLSVSFDDGSEEGDACLFKNERIAHVTLVEHNASEKELNDGSVPVAITVCAQDGRVPNDVTLGPWKRMDEEDTYGCDIVFPTNGTYALHIQGTDKANNVLVGSRDTEVNDEGAYDSGTFTIDDENPSVSIAYAADAPEPKALDGVDYFGSPVAVEVTVVDRNPAVDNMRVEDSWGRSVTPSWQVSNRGDNGEITCSTTLVYSEQDAQGSLEPCVITVVAEDQLGNTSTCSAKPFVVDQQGPEVTCARLSVAPFSVGDDGSPEGPTLFFNARQSASPALILELADTHALDSAWVSDPRSIYDQKVDLRGRKAGTLTIPLLDAEQDGRARDTVFDDSVRVMVRDFVGHVREWSLGPHGRVIDSRERTCVNTPLQGDVAHPHALVLDACAPKVHVSGAESGQYSKVPLMIHVSVEEFNMERLKKYDPMRVVATLQRRTRADAQGTQTSVVNAWQLKDEGGTYGFDMPLEEDGHYTVAAQLSDYAGNKSSAEIISNVTIDTTPPRVEVTWDNNDVHNAMYYRAPRTATICVTEHNFDPQCFVVQTTGVASAWETEGDVHTCTVSFAQDAPASAPHTLSVRGEDLAHNQSNEVAEQPFALDTHQPKVALLKRVQDRSGTVESELIDKSAFSESLGLRVLLSDEMSIDVESVSVSLEGKRGTGRDGLPFVAQARQISEGEYELVWDDLGALDGEQGPSYDVLADDLYTIVAQVRDKAGNESEIARASFSLNRFGSNFFVGRVGDLHPADDGSWPNDLIAESPYIEIHEVNVSGAQSELVSEDAKKAHLVTKEHARMTQAIELAQDKGLAGYTLSSTTEQSDLNPYEGWTEYTYVIRPGNFGKGSDSDFGDGGQGHYDVNVSSFDAAANVNTLVDFWGSTDRARSAIEHKSATVGFTLDEEGPRVEDASMPSGFIWGQTFEATFYVNDAQTDGDYVSVRVDGQPVEVRWADSGRPLDDAGRIDHGGALSFSIEATSVFAPRSIAIEVSDYTGQKDRRATLYTEGFCVTTLVNEVVLVAVVAGALVVAHRLSRRAELVRRERSKHGSSDTDNPQSNALACK